MSQAMTEERAVPRPDYEAALLRDRARMYQSYERHKKLADGYLAAFRALGGKIEYDAENIGRFKDPGDAVKYLLEQRGTWMTREDLKQKTEPVWGRTKAGQANFKQSVTICIKRYGSLIERKDHKGTEYLGLAHFKNLPLPTDHLGQT